MEFKSNLTENDLYTGRQYGIFHVLNPLVGYKQIKCNKVWTNSNLIDKSKDNQVSFHITQTVNAIVELEIPVGATVVRPMEPDDLKSLYGNLDVRTDQAFVKNIYPITSVPSDRSLLDCDCYSTHDNTYKYEVGKLHQPREKFNDNPSHSFGSGIYFHMSVPEH